MGSALLHGFLDGVGLGDLDRDALLALIQDDEFNHADLYRRARRAHERRLSAARSTMCCSPSSAVTGAARGRRARAFRGRRRRCIPYVPGGGVPRARAHEARAARRRRSARVALVADGVGGDARRHAHARGDPRARRPGLRGRGRSAPTPTSTAGCRPSRDVEVPFYPGLGRRRPEPARGRRDAGRLAATTSCTSARRARAGGGRDDGATWSTCRSSAATTPSLPPMRPCAPPTRASRRRCSRRCRPVLRRLRSSCSLRARPRTRCCDARRRCRPACGAGTAASTSSVSTPSCASPELLPGEINVLYAGRLTPKKGADLLADAFLAARERDPRLHLCLAGGGPEEARLRARLGEHATFLGWLEGDGARARLRERRRVPVREPHRHVRSGAAGSAGLWPAGDRGRRGRAARDRARRSHRPAAPPEPQALADALCEVVSSPLLRERLVAGALNDARQRSWDAALGLLAAGYSRALAIRDAAGDAPPELALAS